MYVMGGIGQLGQSLMNAGRWHEVMQCQHRIAEAKSLSGGLELLFREGDKKEKRPRRRNCEEVRGGKANYV